MGHKISPISLRMGFTQDWRSRYFAKKDLIKYLKEDTKIRQALEKRLRFMSVANIEIERSPGEIKIIIYTSRPGLIIGRGGAGSDEIKKEMEKAIKSKNSEGSSRGGTYGAGKIKIEIQEYKNPETSAAIMAEQIIEKIERRMPFRRVLKQALAKIVSSREVKGAKIEIKGRLDGSEIARTEHMEEGLMPLQKLTANIDFAKNTAYTTYGTVGVKVWIYRNDSDSATNRKRFGGTFDKHAST